MTLFPRTGLPARGLALVSVLLIVAVTTALAYEIANRHAFGVAVTRQMLEGSQARQYALGGELYARQLLYGDWENEATRTKDTLLESWWTLDDAFDVDDGSIELRIVDLASRFNLNSLLGRNGAENLARLKRLLTHLELDSDAADAWLDWIDADQETSAFGAEDADHLLRFPPYRTAGQGAVHESEWRLAVAAGEPNDFARLKPYVAVLPTEALSVNVNTASAALLTSLVPNFPITDAQLLAEGFRNFDRIEDVVADHVQLGAGVDALAVASEYFRVQVRALFGDSRVDLTSIIHRGLDTGEISVLARSYGERFEQENADKDVAADS